MTFEKTMVRNKSVFFLRLFIYLASAELLISGVITVFLVSKRGLESTLVVSALIAFGGLFGFFIPALLQQNGDFENKLVAIFKGNVGNGFPFIMILLIAAFFWIVAPTAKVALVVSPLLICIWLIGLEILLLFSSFQVSERGERASPFGRNEKIARIASLIFAYVFLLIPSRILTWFDGFPWDSPPEFICAAFLVPLAFIAGGKFFAKRFLVFSFVGLIVVKIIIFNVLPQSGLGIHAYTSEVAASVFQWDRSYYTFATPGYTQVINRPYYTFREFPVEWVNSHFGFKRSQFWLKLGLSGYIQLQEDERLIFIVQGAKQMQGELLDVFTQTSTPLVFLEQIEDANRALYATIPEAREVKIQGTILYDSIGKMHLEPLLLYSGGLTKPLFESSRVWTSPQGANYPINRVNIIGFILKVMGFLFAGLVLACFFMGMLTLWQNGKIFLTSLYLALSGLPLFFVTFLIHKKYLNILALSIILVIYTILLIDRFLNRRQFSWMVFLFSVGVVLLCLFLALDAYDLDAFTNLPQGQDGLEYQTFARKIYIDLDIFLAKTPPRAYKVLFPYIVGLLHIFFGHSAAAQLFLNTWCAVISGILIIELMKELGLNDRISVSAATYYLLVLFLPSLYIFYFRFGLIEPFATTFLLLTYYFAIKHRRMGMFLSGVLTILLRLDYLGMAFSAILLTGIPLTGSLKNAWSQLFGWLKSNWKILSAYLTSLCLPVLIIVLGYFLFTPNYILNASDTHQVSFQSLIEGLIRVIAGWTINDLREVYTEFWVVNVLLISTPLVVGFFLVVVSAFVRTSFLKNFDLRLCLMAISLLPTYFVVRPTGYLPRFSLPLLPLSLIVISSFSAILFQFLKSYPPPQVR